MYLNFLSVTHKKCNHSIKEKLLSRLLTLLLCVEKNNYWLFYGIHLYLLTLFALTKHVVKLHEIIILLYSQVAFTMFTIKIFW